MRKVILIIVVMLSILITAADCRGEPITEMRYGNNQSGLVVTTYPHNITCNITVKNGYFTIETCTNGVQTLRQDHQHPEKGWWEVK